ncbi:MAG: hypothetical protein ABIR70_05965 [Bryobacteraceae bacterium]
MKPLLLSLSLITFANAQSADDYRGGWRTDEKPAAQHTYEFSIRGDVVRGIYCTRCSDATTLAFIDGKLTPAGLTFTVTHVRPDGKTEFQDRATAKVDRGNLIVTGTSGAKGGGNFTWTMIKDPRGPDPLPIPIIMLPAREVPVLGGRGGGAPKGPPAGGGAPAAGPGYLQPAPWKQLTADDVVGIWLGFGAGINKQYFIFKKVGTQLRGMVCGRCDNPYTMAALDDIEIQGDTLKFNIRHDDWGDYSIPFDKHVTAHIGANEMRATTTQDNLPPGRNNGGAFSLMGPISIDATKGNP